MGTVYSFLTGSVMQGETREEIALEQDAEIIDTMVRPEQRERLLDRLEKIKGLVEKGRINSLVIVGNDPVTGYFLTEILIDEATDRTELFAYMGVLDCLKLEMCQDAALAPAMDADGVILDPFEDYEEDEEP